MSNTEIEMTIKGEVATLRLQPDDKVVISLKHKVTRMVLDAIRAQARTIFPNNEVVMLEEGIEINIARFDDGDPGDENDYSRTE